MLDVIVTPAGRPAWNMAVDEALLAGGGDELILRLYGWRPHGLSLGFFQPLPEPDRLDSLAADGIEVVRRLTGGGAILHGDELTYALVGSDETPPFAGPVERSYRLVHDALIAALAGLGVAAGYPETAPRALKRSQQPFYCFARCTALDLVAAGRKLVGSAKRRRGGRALQHGSIVLSAPDRSSECASLRDLAPGPIRIRALREGFVRHLAQQLSIKDVRWRELTRREEQLAGRLEEERYSRVEDVG